MLFGQSVFQSVIERLKAEEEEAAAERDNAADESLAFRVAGLNSSFVPETSFSHAPSAREASAAYLDFLPELRPPEPEKQPVMPAHLARLSPEEIIEELAIATTDTAATLAEKRRNFARANHPDMIHPDFRDNASARMKIANRLIDEALRLISLQA